MQMVTENILIKLHYKATVDVAFVTLLFISFFPPDKYL